MATTKVKLGEAEWEFDGDNLTLEDAFLIKSETGMALRPFLRGVADLDPICLQGLVWFCRRKSGELIPIKAVQFKIRDLDIEQDDDEEDADPPA